MTKSKKVRYRKGTTLLRANRYVVDGHGKQYIINLLKYHLLIGINNEDFYVRFGDKGKGFMITKNLSFSVRNKYKKSFKLCKYYIVKID